MLNEFKNTAAQFSNAKAQGAQAKSLSNRLIGEACYIILRGDVAEKIALRQYVAKDSAGYAYRQHVSRAKAIVTFFESNDSIALKDGEFTKESLEAGSFEALPEVAFSSVYSAINALTKGEKGEESRRDTALALAMEQQGYSKDDVKILSAVEVDMLVQQGEAILASMEAKQHLDGLASVKHTIEAMGASERAALVAWIATLDAAETTAQAA